MIVGFLGRMGSGKTLSAVREVYKYYLRGNKILSNTPLNFPYEELDFEKLFQLAQDQVLLDNVVILLDEVHILVDSRSGMTKVSKTISYWLSQTRKAGIKLFWTSQYAHQCDKRLRSGTDLFVYCDGLTVVRNGKEYFVCQNEITNDTMSKREIFLGNDFFHLYDTRKVIRFVTKDEASLPGRGRDRERDADDAYAGAHVPPELPLDVRDESEEAIAGRVL